MDRRTTTTQLVLLALLAGTLVFLGRIALGRRDVLAAVGQEIHFDDVAFAIKGVRQDTTVGPPELGVRAYGKFWIVDLEVSNRGRRMGYRMGSHTPVLVGRDGKEIGVSSRGQAAYDAERSPLGGDGAMLPYNLGPGETIVTTLVFDVPEGVADARLKLVFGGAVGEALDYVFLGQRRFALR